MKKILLGAIAVVVVMAGCTAAAHLKALQPRPVPASPQLTIPQTVTISQPAFQRGIDVDAYTYPRHDFSAAAAAVVAYAKSLNANSLSISFPFFMSGRYSSRVFASSRTPTPTELALLITDAERAGLFVSLRPLLSEGNIGHSRVIWKPAHPAAWFASYRRFLLPYARMAQANKLGEFIVGAEFTRFGDSPRWNGLDRALAKVFHGELAYSNNDTRGLSQSSGGRVAIKTVDAYHPIHPPFLRGWKSFDRRLPADTVLTEVSIAAIDGAWRRPWVHQSQGARINPLVQARWFTAACHAAMATGLDGIYFWAIPLSTRFPSPTLATPGAWAHSAGSAAIARCFGTAK
jgi:hypothetical protein